MNTEKLMENQGNYRKRSDVYIREGTSTSNENPAESDLVTNLL